MDERFSKIAKDPRFKKIPKGRRKIKIDSRFKRMFTDRKFHTRYLVDKRGRKLKKTSTEDLHKFYDLPDEKQKDINSLENAELSDKLNEENKWNEDYQLNTEPTQTDAGTDHNSFTEKDTLPYNIDSIKLCKVNSEQSSKDRNKIINEIEENTLQEKNDSDTSNEDRYNFDNIRGEGSEDSSEEDEQEDANFENEVEHDWHLDVDVKREDANETNRLAVCHLDWDRVTANDIFVLLNSFKPSEGTVRSVKIYPSEYGLKRMSEEDVSGPRELQTELIEVPEDSKDLTEGSSYDAEKVRQYQLSRLKYYYAVVECDSKETADKIYSECDTMEYQLSGTRLDLRFIPEDVTFDVDPKSVATDVPSLSNYKPAEFITSALQQSNARLTWDEPDPKRIKTTMRNFSKDDLLDMDFESYLASSSDEGSPENATSPTLKNKDDEGSNSEDDEDKRIAKYRALLLEIEDKEKKENEEEEMEISWDVGLTKVAQKAVEEKKQKDEEKEMTPFQKYQKEKKKRRRDKTTEKSEDVVDTKSNGSTHDVVDDGDVEERDSDSGLRDDTIFRDSFDEELKLGEHRKQKRKKKRKKREDNLTEEEKKEQQRNKDELELILMDDQEEKQHFNYKSILEKESKKKKRKRKKDSSGLQEQKDNFEIDVKDNRFKALFTSHHFAIDPTDHQFKKSKAMETIIEEKQNRREEVPSSLSQNQQETGSEKNKLDPSLSALVKTVKSKTEQFHHKKRKRKLK